MEKKNNRNVDNLGRVILPLSFRRTLNWEAGDEIAMYLDEEGGVVTLKLHKEGKKNPEGQRA